MTTMERVMSAVWAAVLLVIILTLWTASARGAEVDQIKIPYPAVLSCFGIEKALKVNTYLGNVRGMKMFVMEVDSNEDGKKDILLLFPIYSVREETDDDVTIEVSIAPSHIILDRNYDGHPDEAWFDRTAKGTCETLQSVPVSSLLRSTKDYAYGL